jgi:hypothetical protein
MKTAKPLRLNGSPLRFVNAIGETLAVTTLQTTQIKRIDLRGAVLHVNERILTEAA